MILLLLWIVMVGGLFVLVYVFVCCGMLSCKLGGMGGYVEYVFGKVGNYMVNYMYGLLFVIVNVVIGVMVVGYGIVLFDVMLLLL